MNTIKIGNREFILEQPRPLFSEMSEEVESQLPALLARQIAMLTPEQIEEIKRVDAALLQDL